MSATGAFAANKVCDTVDFSTDKGFVSQQWQVPFEDENCTNGGILEVLLPAGIQFKLYQHEGAKCAATRRGRTLRINFSLDIDSSDNCQLFMIKGDGTKAILSITAPIGS